MNQSEYNPKLLLPILLTVLIDMIGVGVVVPVMPQLFFDQDSIVSAGLDNATRSMLYGLLSATYPLMQFFGAPVLGALSDRYGRKQILQLSLIGTVIGYLLFGYAIVINNLPLLFISRMIPGFLGGNISIALSAISDLSTPETRTKNFGLIGMAFGIGFVIGPALGGLLADDRVVSWFDHATPFWFTAVLTLLNVYLVQTIFKETLKVKQQTTVSFTKGIGNITRAFSDPALRTIFAVILLISLGFSFFTQFFGAYLIQGFDYSEFETGKLFGWIGLWLAFTQAVIVRRLSAKFQPKALLPYSLLAMCISVGLLLLPTAAWWFYITNPLIAIAQGVTSPNLTTEVSSQAGAARQGEILGINQSMQSLGMVVPCLVAGYLNAIDIRFPLLAAAIFIGAGWAVYVFLFRRSVQAN